ncbi:thioredoxin family protein [Pedobacter sp. V48]|uniref:thioredoxin family protein n=1 Tax=Pedobacter sp. V48 TaxID=509635 RepID=UPI0004B1D5E0|nr:thioredoxin family protein [Pedobacter sp. V48]
MKGKIIRKTAMHTVLAAAILILCSFAGAKLLRHSQNAASQDGVAKNGHIAFIEDSLAIAIEKAKSEQKFIFVDAYAKWCGPCKKLKSTTFKNKQAADLFNKNFINLSMDMEKDDGIKLAGQWEINEYPALLILDTKGQIILRAVGYLDADQLINFGRQALKKKL